MYLGWILSGVSLSVEHFFAATAEEVQAQIDERWEEIRKEEDYDDADEFEDPMLGDYTSDCVFVPDIVPTAALETLATRVLTDCIDVLELGVLEDPSSWLNKWEAWEDTARVTLDLLESVGIDSRTLENNIRKGLLSE